MQTRLTLYFITVPLQVLSQSWKPVRKFTVFTCMQIQRVGFTFAKGHTLHLQIQSLASHPGQLFCVRALNLGCLQGCLSSRCFLKSGNFMRFFLKGIWGFSTVLKESLPALLEKSLSGEIAVLRLGFYCCKARRHQFTVDTAIHF